jgi:hypothetical protein
MQNVYKRYFWDGSVESFSEEYKMKRIFEYASFPDLIKYPFHDVKNNLSKIDINSLRTGNSRKEFIFLLKPYVLKSLDWEEAITTFVKDCLE